MISQNTLNQLNRRKWLRDAAIATTSAAVLPSLLTSCTDHPMNPGSGLVGAGSAPPDDALYPQAADNLKRMRAWYEELDKRNSKYLLEVYTDVKGGEVPPTNWKDILIDVFVKIGIAFLEAATEEIPGLGVAIAIAAEEYEKWGHDKSNNGSVDAAFGEFTDVQLEIYRQVDNRLRDLAEDKGDYPLLRDLFKNGGSFEFKGKKYDLRSLALTKFPASDSGDFVKLITPAEYSFRRTLWYALIVKVGEWHTFDTGSYLKYSYGHNPRKIISDLYANNTDIPGAYFRAYENPGGDFIFVREYQFLFDKRKLDDKTAAKLFKDDVKGHVIHPDALFERDYVFKQFHAEKPDFGKYCDVAPEYSSEYYDCSDFKFPDGILK